MNVAIGNFFKENGLQITLQVATAVIFLLNLFLTSKLAPLAQNIDSVITRVNAVEIKLNKTSEDHTDIQVIKEQVLEIRGDVKEIKDSLKYLQQY